MDDLTKLGRYQLLRVLGRGAMGVVYEGVDPKLNRQVAVKLISQSFTDDVALKAEYSARFVREAQAVARLSHANIVTVFDFGEEDGVMYIVMEYIHGAELKESFDQGRRFSLAEIVRMCSELLDALDYAHSKGIIHRDIKPANVMIDAQLRVQLTDFGVARLTDSGHERTQVGTMVGTPSYMSPEQIAGIAVGARSDLFAVGVILYQFLTNQKPFEAVGTFAIQQKIMLENPALPSSINTTVSNAFDCVVFRALAKSPDDRYESARAFKEDLQRALAGEQLQDGNTLPFTANRPLLDLTQLTQMQQSGNQVLSGEALNAGLELEFWRAIKDSQDADEISLYLKRYPQGVYAELATRKLARLRGEPSLTVSITEAALATGATSVEATQVMPRDERTKIQGSAPPPNAAAAPTPAASAKPAATPPRTHAIPPSLVPTDDAMPRKSKALPLGLAVVGMLIVALYFVLASNQPPNPEPTPTPTPVTASVPEKIVTTPSPTPQPTATPTPAIAQDAISAPENKPSNSTAVIQEAADTGTKATGTRASEVTTDASTPLTPEQLRQKRRDFEARREAARQKIEESTIQRTQELAEKRRQQELNEKAELERKRREELAEQFRQRAEKNR